jgi:hypothetical protein
MGEVCKRTMAWLTIADTEGKSARLINTDYNGNTINNNYKR